MNIIMSNCGLQLIANKKTGSFFPLLFMSHQH